MKVKLTIVPKINLKSTKFGINPMIPAVEDRPKCSKKGCCKPRAIINTLKDGTPNYRTVCQSHHQKNICAKNGVSSTQRLTAERQGLTLSEYANQYHPYRKYRKEYCENKDGRLGYKCTATIVWDGQLDVDHMDGNPSNNNPANLQTLCKCCHAYKTNINEDYVTPGRKALGVR